MDTEPQPILARATIHLPGGLAPGESYWVDPRAPYVKDCLKAKYLVRVRTPREPDPTPESDPTPDPAPSPEGAAA